ncbi:MAG TPA: sulfate adenylyltransferase subunit CysD [Verrucomicrobiota bacterium]|nr:sulfate adenylyltransferase subunit CysD [Verrucomicrobiota bacterium]HNT13983.1 sulfate adenylyltransferase subunit CysD [Verrucomicrobiota bacterium]
MNLYQLDHLQYLETEAIHILREVAGEFERPALLFSGGKDSICLLRLAEKAFRPADIPLPLLNVETGHEFPELIQFRDRRARELGARLIVRTVEAAIADGLAHPVPGEISRNKLQIPVLLGAIEEFQFDCAIGGARRDEEKARAKERFFSFRDRFGQWDPKAQRPEIWHLYNARVNPGENMRVFPLSNWTEMDVWQYIQREQLAVPSIYFSHEREVVRRHNQWVPVPPPPAGNGAADPYHGARPQPGEPVQKLVCRVRTIGDMISTGMIESPADSVEDIIAEVAAARVTERGNRADDKCSEAAMEDRKKAGYF